MHLRTRKIIDRSATGIGILAIVVMTAALVVLLAPIFANGTGAFVFRGTAEFRKYQSDRFDRGDREVLTTEKETLRQVRQPVYDLLHKFEHQLKNDDDLDARFGAEFPKLKREVYRLIGPPPGEALSRLERDEYGATRWDRALVQADSIVHVQEDRGLDSHGFSLKVEGPRAARYKGTSLEPMFGYVEMHLAELLRPQWTFYPQFLIDNPQDANFFGGIGPAVLGTIYLTLGAILFAVPMGVITAIYLVEYAGQGRFISLLRTCISTLAGVPSIVFGLFGLAFFINTIHVSPSKSVLAGSLTLGLLILPTIIRASEEALRAVPLAYKEAALSLGAGQWRTILTVILPAALPGILTGIIISMGRAAGETAPIIFTAAVSVGLGVKPWEVFTSPTQ